MKAKKIYTLHKENKEWMNDLLAEVEHFQNQFILQSDTIGSQKHEVNLNNDSVNCEIQKTNVALECHRQEDHIVLKERASSFKKIFNFLKTELSVFISEWI